MTSPTSTQLNRHATLVKFAKRGCADSFEILVREFQFPLRAFLIGKIGDATAADDLAQEVFFSAFKSVDNLNDGRSFRSWLFTVARNKAVDYLRAKSRVKESPSGSLEQLLAQPQSELFQDNTRLLGTLQNCLKELTPRSRSIVNSFYFESKTSAAIAEELKTKSSAVRMSLMRIRKSLASCIQMNSAGELDE